MKTTLCFALSLVPFLLAINTVAQQISPSAYQQMRWRSIGPHRAGRVSAVAGVPGNNAVFYIGTPGGGVWKTMDAGQTWTPIFDSVPMASIGAVAVAPSNPKVIYVGTGEQTQGNGVYRSDDAGATWRHLGLDNTHFINGIIVDPKNPDIVMVGVSGDSLSLENRGVFKSSDGGKTWRRRCSRTTTPPLWTSTPTRSSRRWSMRRRCCVRWRHRRHRRPGKSRPNRSRMRTSG